MRCGPFWLSPYLQRAPWGHLQDRSRRLRHAYVSTIVVTVSLMAGRTVSTMTMRAVRCTVVMVMMMVVVMLSQPDGRRDFRDGPLQLMPGVFRRR